MKSISISLIVLLSTLYSGFAQVRMGLSGGLQQSKIKELNQFSNWNEQFKPFFSSLNGIHLGISTEIGLGDLRHWALQSGAWYSQKGRIFSKTYDSSTAAVSDTLSIKSTSQFNYIEIPFLLSYKVNFNEKQSLIFGAGPNLGLYMNGKEIVESRIFSTGQYSKETNYPEVGNTSGKIHTMDWGMKYMIGMDWGKWMISAFYNHSLTPFYQTSAQSSLKNQVLGATLTIWLNEKELPKPKDSDNDGIPDEDDQCPQLSGSAKTYGCPDTDGDGIPDKTDKCVDVKGFAKYKGCPAPDADKDGIPDDQDKCPSLTGVSKYAGCPIPDSDADGINDELDKCPTIKGVKEQQGCPWPDIDGDKIPDYLDKCPSVFGDSSRQGCPEINKALIDKFSFAAQKIFFAYKSDSLLNSSWKVLDELAKILVEHPEIKVNIEGHTDNVGNEEYNHKLSHSRANAVQAYFIKKGVNLAQCKAEGFGSKKPIADNKTEQGRARNRRVELKPFQ